MLHHDRVTADATEPTSWIVVLHGIYGAGRNWSSLMRRVVRARPEWGAVLVDLREHGGSRGFPPPHTLEAAADDVSELLDSLRIRADAILGHSFGGKVSLMLARRHADAVGQLWIMDSTPSAREFRGQAAEMLKILRRHPGPFASRDEAIDALVGEGVSRPIAMWMATNLEPAGDELRWRIDFDVMEALLEDFHRSELWDVVESPAPGHELRFLQATRASVLTEEDAARIEAAGRATGRVFLHRVEGGHWLNADNPDALVALLEEHLP